MRIPIFDIDNWKEIGVTLARNKTRTFLTGFGIFWGTAMLAILLGGARGAQDLMMRNFAGFATNSGGLWALQTSKAYHGHGERRSWSIDITDVERLQQAFPEIKAFSPNYNSSSSFRHGKYSYSGNCMGMAPSYSEIMAPTIYSGRFLNDADISNERKVAVIGKKVASELYPNLADPVGQPIEISGITYNVVGVMGQTSEVSMGGRLDESVGIPASTFRRAFKRGDTVDYITFVAHDRVKISSLKPRLRRLLYSRHYIAPDDEGALSIFDISEQFQMVDNLFKGLSLLAMFIGISTLLAGVIGIGNIMWVIVKERTQEIGIRRAVGAKKLDIITQILSEGMVLTAVAGLAGICFATIALGITQSLTANEISTPQFQMNLRQAIAIILTFGILGTLAGLIPATKAMRIKPIEALNDK